MAKSESAARITLRHLSVRVRISKNKSQYGRKRKGKPQPKPPSLVNHTECAFFERMELKAAELLTANHPLSTFNVRFSCV